MPSTHHRPTERVLDILELLANTPEGLTLTEISEALGAPKSSIMPLVHTMAARKFIYWNRNASRYRIGIAAFSAGSAYAQEQSVLQFLHGVMKQIVKDSGEICQLGIEDRGTLLYIAKEDSDEPIRLISHVGKHLPLHCTAMGKILLAYRSPGEIRAMYPDGLQAVTPRTVTDFDALFGSLEHFRSLGYAIEHEEATDHIHCVAVALCKGPQAVAGLSVSVPGFRMTKEKTLLIIRLLTEAKTRIDAYLADCDVDELTAGYRFRED